MHLIASSVLLIRFARPSWQVNPDFSVSMLFLRYCLYITSWMRFNVCITLLIWYYVIQIEKRIAYISVGCLMCFPYYRITRASRKYWCTRFDWQSWWPRSFWQHRTTGTDWIHWTEWIARSWWFQRSRWWYWTNWICGQSWFTWTNRTTWWYRISGTRGLSGTTRYVSQMLLFVDYDYKWMQIAPTNADVTHLSNLFLSMM